MGVFTIVYIVGLIIYQVSNMFLLKIKQLDSEFLWLTDLDLYFPNSIYVSSKMRQIIEHIIVSLSKCSLFAQIYYIHAYSILEVHQIHISLFVEGALLRKCVMVVFCVPSV